MNASTLAEMTAILDWLPMEEQRLRAQSISSFSSGSQAARDASETDAEAIDTAVTQARLSILSAGDHMVALGRVLDSDILTFSPWTITRTVLEAVSRSLWITDQECDPQTRVSRSLMVRLENIEDQMKVLSVHPEEGADEQVSHLKDRRADVLKKARVLGLAVSRGKGKGKPVTKLGDTSRPRSTDLVRDTLGEEWSYRVLSGAEHQRSWALANLSMRKLEGVNVLAPDLPNIGQFFLVSGSLTWFATAAWRFFQYCGLDEGGLEAVLQEAARRAGLRDRFWEGKGLA